MKKYFGAIMFTSLLVTIVVLQCGVAYAADPVCAPAAPTYTYGNITKMDAEGMKTAITNAYNLGPAIFVDSDGNIVTMDKNGKETIIGKAHDLGPAIAVDSDGNIVTMDKNGKETIIGKAHDLGPAIAVDSDGNIVTVDENGNAVVRENTYSRYDQMDDTIIIDDYGNVFKVDDVGNENLVYYIADDTQPVWVTPNGAKMTFDEDGESIVVDYVTIEDLPVPMAASPIPAYSISSDAVIQDIDTAYSTENKIVLFHQADAIGLCDFSQFTKQADNLFGVTMGDSIIIMKNPVAGICGYFPCSVTEKEGMITISIG